MSTLRGRLIATGAIARHRPYTKRKACAVCRLFGHYWNKCQVRARLEALGLPLWARS